jgi:hypothetical protein
MSHGTFNPEPGQRNVDGGLAEETPLYVDIAALLSGGLPDSPQPAVLARSDGVGLFYSGQVNLLFGEPETGKTWIALAALAEQLRAGGVGLVIDLDHNGAPATVARLQALGVQPETLADPRRFRFAQPEDAAHLDRVVADARKSPPTVAVIDSVGELLPMLGLGSNSPDDFTSAHTRVLKPLAVAGAAVIAIDHVAKSQASKAQGPTGTAAKKRAIGGVSIRVELVDAYAPGRGGASRLRINKDRHGGLRQHCKTHGAEEPVAGTFQLRDRDGTLTWTITPTAGASVMEDPQLAADLAALDELVPPPNSQQDVKKRMGWGSARSMNALRAWRAANPTDAGHSRPPAHQQEAAPRSSTPVSGSEEHTESAASEVRSERKTPHRPLAAA